MLREVLLSIEARNIVFDLFLYAHVKLRSFLYCSEGLASRKLSTIGTIVVMRDISVTCVVSGKMANFYAERGRRSQGTSPPFRRYISAM